MTLQSMVEAVIADRRGEGTPPAVCKRTGVPRSIRNDVLCAEPAARRPDARGYTDMHVILTALRRDDTGRPLRDAPTAWRRHDGDSTARFTNGMVSSSVKLTLADECTKPFPPEFLHGCRARRCSDQTTPRAAPAPSRSRPRVTAVAGIESGLMDDKRAPTGQPMTSPSAVEVSLLQGAVAMSHPFDEQVVMRFPPALFEIYMAASARCINEVTTAAGLV